jgi:hypothetical protein
MRATVGFSCQPEMLEQIDDRAASLGFTRSQYIQMLVRGDILQNKDGNFTAIVSPKPKAKRRKK